jgi:hypothetical protein
MMVVTMKFLLVLNVLAVFTEAFHASHRGWIKVSSLMKGTTISEKDEATAVAF